MKYLLDTNVISELLAKNPNERVTEWIDTREPDSVYLSVVTIGEIQRGIERLGHSRRKETLTKWLQEDLLERFQGRVLEVGIKVMLRWGLLTAEMERKGRQLPAIDSLIAAIALDYDCVLVTRNEADFQATGVKILNPWTQVE